MNILQYHFISNFCLLEVIAMAQQPLVECTAIITVCIVEHRPPPCAVTKPAQINSGMYSTDQRSMCW